MLEWLTELQEILAHVYQFIIKDADEQLDEEVLGQDLEGS